MYRFAGIILAEAIFMGYKYKKYLYDRDQKLDRFIIRAYGIMTGGRVVDKEIAQERVIETLGPQSTGHLQIVDAIFDSMVALNDRPTAASMMHLIEPELGKYQYTHSDMIQALALGPTLYAMFYAADQAIHAYKNCSNVDTDFEIVQALAFSVLDAPNQAINQAISAYNTTYNNTETISILPINRDVSYTEASTAAFAHNISTDITPLTKALQIANEVSKSTEAPVTALPHGNPVIATAKDQKGDKYIPYIQKFAFEEYRKKIMPSIADFKPEIQKYIADLNHKTQKYIELASPKIDEYISYMQKLAFEEYRKKSMPSITDFKPEIKKYIELPSQYKFCGDISAYNTIDKVRYDSAPDDLDMV
jgi:hypothetical protein